MSLLILASLARAEPVTFNNHYPLMQFAHHMQARSGHRVTFEGVLDAAEIDLTENFATAPKSRIVCDVGLERASLAETRALVEACVAHANSTRTCKQYAALDVADGVAIVPRRRHNGSACVDVISPLDGATDGSEGFGRLNVNPRDRLYRFAEGQRPDRDVLERLYQDDGSVHVAFPSTYRGELLYVLSTFQVGGPFVGHTVDPDAGPFFHHVERTPARSLELQRLMDAADSNGGDWNVETLGIPPESPQPELD